MSRAVARDHARRGAGAEERRAEAPLVWTFDGDFATCLFDMEDTLRRALVQVGEVSKLAVMIELSLPVLSARVTAGDAIQPAWGRFLETLASRYGLPHPPRVRHRTTKGPLATLWIAYRS